MLQMDYGVDACMHLKGPPSSESLVVKAALLPTAHRVGLACMC